ncbi:MAG: SGNH/GDSL hydrolase family protein [Bacteroidales bacterium]|nr:SGNH/GDSL hydrolase family protein [Bacteroidales bacterium]MCM1414480.1 SGNH/GDSL hydrolase family protein [bacterium]MCM1423742.1 SGNH/GDSL hydrolase family protein [bacterium]
MRKKRIMAGITALMLLLASCGAGNAEERDSGSGQAPQTAEEQGNPPLQSEEESGQKSADAETEAENAEETDDEDSAQAGQPAAGSKLAGKSVSVLGDSISTFRGCNPEGYAVFFPDFGEVTAVEETWWQRVVDDLGLTLYKNGSSSGSTVSGDSTGMEDPLCACNELRTSVLAGPQGACPELIIVYLGTNDLLNAVPLGSNDGTTPVEEGEVAVFSDAYTLMIDKLQAYYPLAELFCCTLLPVGRYGTSTPYVDSVNELGLTAADYNQVIGQIAENKGLSVIDLYECGITIDNLPEMTTDGVHPTPTGMKCIAETVEKALAAGR